MNSAAASTSRPPAKQPTAGRVAPHSHANTSSIGPRTTAASTARAAKARPLLAQSVKPAQHSKQTPASTSIRGATADRVIKTKHPGTALNQSTRPRVQESRPLTASEDPLQLAAQAYSWAYMTRSLQDCYSASEKIALDALNTRAQELETEETDIADSRTRFEAERLLDFYDELCSPEMAAEAPGVVQKFLQSEDVCVRLVSEALDLSSRSPNVGMHVTAYNDLLDRMDVALSELSLLDSSLVSLTTRAVPDGSRVVPVFVALLRVIRAYCSNLSSAISLVGSCKDAMCTRMYTDSLHLSV